MTRIWVPPNIGPVCIEQQAYLTQCTQIGYLYLTLLAQLFGSSLDSVHKDHFMDYRGNAPGYGQIPGSENERPQPPRSFKHPDTWEYQYSRRQSQAYRQLSGHDSSSEEKSLPKARYHHKRSSGSDESREKPNNNEYDFIVVGAGSSGCVVASRLSENKHWKVLLLEAGPEEVELSSVPGLATALQNSNIDWVYRSQPEKNSCRALRGQQCVWYRGRQMGGSSSINYMVYMRGNKRDYDGWAELGNKGWSYREVLQYFKKSENNRGIESQDSYYHATGGPLNVERYPYADVNTIMIVKGFTELGLPLTDFNGANQIGTNLAQSMSRDGQRYSNNAAFIRPVRYVRRNLKITNNAQVTKILINHETKTAYGVQFVKNGRLHYAYARKEVVVSTGTLSSPKLLMLSGIGPRDHLESFHIPVLADLPVGENLQEQVATDGLILGLSNKTSTWLDGDDLLKAIYDYHEQPEKKNGPLSAAGTLSGTAFIKSSYATEDAPDLQFHFEGRKVNDFYGDPTTYMASKVFPLSFYDGLSARPLLLTPKSRGVVRLNITDPVFGVPMIYPRFFSYKTDVDILLEGIRFLISLEDTKTFKRNGARFIRKPVEACSDYHWGTDDYFKCLLVKYTATLYHPVGTNKMGPKWDKEAVVDPRLRVYGIKHLRVIDCSIMPDMVRANTNAPATMIGEKGADMIKEDWLHDH